MKKASNNHTSHLRQATLKPPKSIVDAEIRREKTRILITQNSLSIIAGGELVVVELAIYLSEMGYDVTIFTWNYGGLMKKIVSKNGVKTITPYDSASVDLKLDDFDIIWVFNQVLPRSIVLDLESDNKNKPKFIFTHLSVLDTSFLDLPYVYDLENRLSSLSLFRAEDSIERYGDKYYGSGIPKLATYNNPAPMSFCTLQRNYRSLKKILIVISNSASNISAVAKKLESQGYAVDTLSKFSKTPKIITADILKKYDLVVSSEKTTQYCLCSGTPIYICDRYGSLGYLNKANYEKAKFHNFSGNIQNKDHRDYEPNEKTVQKIVQDIVANYEGAVKFHKKNRQSFIDQFAIDNVVPKILRSIPDRTIEKFSSDYSAYVSVSQDMTQSFIHNLQGEYPKRVDGLESRIKHMTEELEIAREEIVSLRQQFESLNVTGRIAHMFRRILRRSKAYVFSRNKI